MTGHGSGRVDAYVFVSEGWVPLSYDPARDPSLVAGAPQIVGESVYPTLCQTLDELRGTVVVHAEVDPPPLLSEGDPPSLVRTDFTGSNPSETRHVVEHAVPWIEGGEVWVDASSGWTAWCAGDHAQDGRIEVLTRGSLVFEPTNGRQWDHVVVELHDEAGFGLVLPGDERLAVFLARPAE